MTPQAILDTLEKNKDAIKKELNDEQRQQLRGLLENIAGAQDDDAVEDAVEQLDGFCEKIPLLDELLNQADEQSPSDKGKDGQSGSEAEDPRQIVKRLLDTDSGPGWP